MNNLWPLEVESLLSLRVIRWVDAHSLVYGSESL